MSPKYRISSKERLYSPTPIVEVSLDDKGKEIEKIIICINLPKKEGNALANKLLELLTD